MRFHLMAVVAGLALAAACSEETPGPSQPTTNVLDVNVTPKTLTLRADSIMGTPVGISATNVTHPDLEVDASSATLTSFDPAVADVHYVDDTASTNNKSGYYVYGKIPGTVLVIAQYTQYRDTMTVTVAAHPVTQVVISGGAAIVQKDSSVKFKATLLGAAGDTIRPVLDALGDKVYAPAASFSTPDTALATVSTAGTFTAKAATGTVRVVAKYKNQSKAASPAAADTATVADTTTVTLAP